MNDIVENPLRLQRPGSFDFTGACVLTYKTFRWEKKLNELGIKYVRAVVQEGGIEVHQLFFHDPDGLMIEMCDCNNLPVVPLVGDTAQSCSRWNQPHDGAAAARSSSVIIIDQYPLAAS
ncbi:hypothetical protein Patl1_34478 [Pistacia atlantica]|uniref:Uncharacterized protein n=1 Tax=Pistacia atlantica TaxID=434234 RepID=A0ACC0ZVA7_9ROSI|nr:hypothetical protein Patl1_34478 [Pistacia atlantica]